MARIKSFARDKGFGYIEHPEYGDLLFDFEACNFSPEEGDEVEVVLKDSPFYGEMGGQVGDTGEIRSAQGKIAVRQTVRPLPDLIVHQGKVVKGHVAVSDSVVAEVDLTEWKVVRLLRAGKEPDGMAYSPVE